MLDSCKMVISHLARRVFTRKVKELNMPATLTIVLNMKMGKSHAQRMAGHLLQDVYVKVSVLVFCWGFSLELVNHHHITYINLSPLLSNSKSRCSTTETQCHDSLNWFLQLACHCMLLRSVAIQTCRM